MMAYQREQKYVSSYKYMNKHLVQHIDNCVLQWKNLILIQVGEISHQF